MRERRDTAAWKYVDGRSYGTNSYPRPAAVLRTLQGLVGDEAFLRGMRHYSETWRYRHPYPDDFFASFQEGSGVEEDLGWFWQDFFRGTATADWSVNVSQAREPKPMGYFANEETGEFVLYGSEEEAEPEVELVGDEEAEEEVEFEIDLEGIEEEQKELEAERLKLARRVEDLERRLRKLSGEELGEESPDAEKLERLKALGYDR